MSSSISSASPEALYSYHNAATRLNAELDGQGRLLVRPSGTEPVVRVLAEAEDRAEATALCGSIAALVARELG